MKGVVWLMDFLEREIIADLFPCGKRLPHEFRSTSAVFFNFREIKITTEEVMRVRGSGERGSHIEKWNFVVMRGWVKVGVGDREAFGGAYVVKWWIVVFGGEMNGEDASVTIWCEVGWGDVLVGVIFVSLFVNHRNHPCPVLAPVPVIVKNSIGREFLF